MLIVKAGNPKHVTGPNGLKGLNVAVQARDEVRGVPEGAEGEDRLQPAELPGDNDAVAQVLLGRADAVLTQDTSFAYQAKAHPGKIAVGVHVPGQGHVRHLLP